MSDKILKLSQAQTLYQDLRERINALPTDSDIPEVPVQDVQIDETSVLSNGVANIPYASTQTPGVMKVLDEYGTGINSVGTYKGVVYIKKATDANVKNGTQLYRPIVPSNQDAATFYGLAKASGDTTQSSSSNAVGNYTDDAKQKIQNMLGITDLISTEESSTATAAHAINSTFMMDGKLYRTTAVIAVGDAVVVGTNCEVVKADEVFVKKTDKATSSTAGLVKFAANANYGIWYKNAPEDDVLRIAAAGENEIKAGTSAYMPIVPAQQHKSIYFGLSKLAGVDLASETVTIGTYPTNAQTAIRTLIGAVGKSDIAGSTGETKGIAYFNGQYGAAINTETGGVYLSKADTSLIKAGTNQYKPIVPYNQHESVFYGLAKAAGEDMASSNNTVGTYTTDAQDAISDMLGVVRQSTLSTGLSAIYDAETGFLDRIITNVQDVQINGTSILNNGIANIPKASTSTFGVVKTGGYGVSINNDGVLYVYPAGISAEIKPGTSNYLPIVPSTQHASVYYGLSKLAGVDLASETVTVGTYPTASKTAIRNLIGATSSNVIAVQDEQPTDTDTKIWLPETEDTGIQVPTMEDMVNYVQKTDIATSTTAGIVKIDSTNGIGIESQNKLYVNYAPSNLIKSGTGSYRPITPPWQHESVFYGLAKAAGDTTQAASDNAVGTYTSDASAAIRTMIGTIGNGDYATSTRLGLVKVNIGYGITVDSVDRGMSIIKATSSDIKAGTHYYKPIVPYNQHESVFYALAKAAGDATQSASSNAVGTYTPEAKAAIHTMLGIDPASIAAQVDIPLVETVSGTTPTITGQPNVRYVCGEVSTISITPPASGSVDVIFESGSTATTMTVPSTVKWPAWFDTTTLESNTTYEILITDGVYGSVMTWAT